MNWRSLVSSRFLERITYERLTHLPRYLKALLIRAERAGFEPRQKPGTSPPTRTLPGRIEETPSHPRDHPKRSVKIEAFRWMIEEFKISLFAQELGTAVPVSYKRLDQQLEIIRHKA
jgi:ATP-dependent helicase HrpA